MFRHLSIGSIKQFATHLRSPPKQLELLQNLFPGVLMLDIDQIASSMRYDRGHLYDLHHQGKLPIKVYCGIGNKILFSLSPGQAHVAPEGRRLLQSWG